ncbi:Omp28-related outer membrane protein [uncultured Microscilla sp.]|uniref:Omp28-related outer membrane protein n=1 Tax=uncultured Microscilla sp. TaxID=432653 RepID=UPI0026229ECF|nr:Omp28-related outer membrane protein [uncultured Microscilla sp.]
MNILKNAQLLICLLAISFMVGCAGTEETPQPNNGGSGGNGNGNPTPTVANCTDPLATNYNKDATTDDCGCTYTTNGKVPETIPASITQKVLIEEFTGTWCGYCPSGAKSVHDAELKYPNQVIGIGIHYRDKMETRMFAHLETILGNINSFPGATFNRKAFNGSKVSHPGNSNRNSGQIINNTTSPKLGIAIETNVNSSNEVEVLTYVGIKEKGEYAITVYLIEDKVVGQGRGYDQANYHNDNSSSPFYQKGNPIKGYEHNATLRDILTDLNGFELPTCGQDADKIYKRMFKLKLDDSYNKDNCRIVAFVTDKTSKEVINSQVVKVGETQAWN